MVHLHNEDIFSKTWFDVIRIKSRVVPSNVPNVHFERHNRTVSSIKSSSDTVQCLHRHFDPPNVRRIHNVLVWHLMGQTLDEQSIFAYVRLQWHWQFNGRLRHRSQLSDSSGDWHKRSKQSLVRDQVEYKKINPLLVRSMCHYRRIRRNEHSFTNRSWKNSPSVFSHVIPVWAVFAYK